MNKTNDRLNKAYFTWDSNTIEDPEDDTIIVLYVNEYGNEITLGTFHWEEPGFDFRHWWCELFNTLYVYDGKWYNSIPAPDTNRMIELFPHWKERLEHGIKL